MRDPPGKWRAALPGRQDYKVRHAPRSPRRYNINPLAPRRFWVVRPLWPAGRGVLSPGWAPLPGLGGVVRRITGHPSRIPAPCSKLAGLQEGAVSVQAASSLLRERRPACLSRAPGSGAPVPRVTERGVRAGDLPGGGLPRAGAYSHFSRRGKANTKARHILAVSLEAAGDRPLPTAPLSAAGAGVGRRA